MMLPLNREDTQDMKLEKSQKEKVSLRRFPELLLSSLNLDCHYNETPVLSIDPLGCFYQLGVFCGRPDDKSRAIWGLH